MLNSYANTFKIMHFKSLKRFYTRFCTPHFVYMYLSMMSMQINVLKRYSCEPFILQVKMIGYKNYANFIVHQSTQKLTIIFRGENRLKK